MEAFAKLKYRIHNIPKSVNLLDEFPEFKSHTALLGDNQNELLRYLIYMYDPNSDLIKQEPDYSTRKAKAAQLSNYYPQDIDYINSKALYFLTRIYWNRKWREWNILQFELYENCRARLITIKEDENQNQKTMMEAYQKKGLLSSQAIEIQKRLDTLDLEIFGDNTDVLRHAEQTLLTTPEAIAAAYY